MNQSLPITQPIEVTYLEYVLTLLAAGYISARKAREMLKQ